MIANNSELIWNKFIKQYIKQVTALSKYIGWQIWIVVGNMTHPTTKDAWGSYHLTHCTRELDRCNVYLAQQNNQCWFLTVGSQYQYFFQETVVPRTDPPLIYSILNVTMTEPFHQLFINWYQKFRRLVRSLIFVL